MFKPERLPGPIIPQSGSKRGPWIWLHYAATKLARGELYEAIGMLAFFREQVLGPLIYRRAWQKPAGGKTSRSTWIGPGRAACGDRH